MKKLMEALNSGTVEQQIRRKNGILLICATIVLIVIALVILTIGGIVMAVSDKEPENPNDSENGATGYTTTTLDEAMLEAGDLLLLDSDHPYGGEDPDTVLFANHKSRPKKENGKAVYTIFGTDKMAATEETVIAFHALLTDFYAESEDDNLILDLAYNTMAGNQADPIYEAGTALSLSYYVDFDLDPTNVASIYEVEKYEWIYENAAKYGFIQVSKEKGEENVFRYVGQPHATYMAKNNKTLSEYLKLLEERTYSSALKTSAEDAEGKSISYSVYRVSADETAYVPEHGKYTVSGDNKGGYIITVNNTEGKKK